MVPKLTFGAVLVLALAFTDAVAQSPPAISQNKPGSKPSEPYFQMNDREKEQFISKARQIKLGDSPQNVLLLLGKPDSDYRTAPKKRPTPMHRRVYYFVKRINKDSVNDRFDEYVEFTFDETDHLIDIWSRVPGIPSQRK